MKTSRSKWISVLLCKAALLLGVVPLGLVVGCASGPRAVRGSDTPGLDNAAMGTGLDRKDLQQMMQENMQALANSRAAAEWQAESRPPLSVLPIRNETSEHIDSALGALITDMETELINLGVVRVVSMENQQDLLREIQRQHHSDGAFDASQIASWGKQLGARYLLTGKVFSTDERSEGARRVQYYLFVRVLSVETGEVIFQNKAAVTKAII